MIRFKLKKPFSPGQVLAFGFAAIILLGAALLMLPFCSRDGESISFLDALFTSTSATCVTGLTVFDTWSQFTFWGQFVILLLIQIGGLGFMAFALLFSMALGRRVGLMERSILAETLAAAQIGGVVRLMRRILLSTFLIEGVGAILLYIRFCPLFGPFRGAWYALFHAVSAFCNAGFDLMGSQAPYASLTAFRADALVSLTVTALLVVGGLGFVVWDDVLHNRFRWRSLTLHSRIVLTATASLLLGGGILLLLLERNASFSGMGFGERLLAAIFQSATPRTAGFSTISPAALSQGGRVLLTVLMFVGASPGSTAGGVKTTTLAVILASMNSYLRGRRDVNLFHYQLEPRVVRRAYCSMTLYSILILAGVFVMTGQGVAAADAMFEAVSAIGTVGLSMGITPTLPALSQLALILLMYSGRVGSLSVFMAVTERWAPDKLQNPVGKVYIG